MKRTILLASIVLGMMSCKKEEEVTPQKTTPVYVAPETNNVRITVHSVAAMDSIKLEYGPNYMDGNLVRSINDNDQHYLCNLKSGLYRMSSPSDCYGGYLEITGKSYIRVIYSGDVTVEYLPSTL